MENTLIGESESIEKIRELGVKMAGSELNTVIQGETGVGKELVAESLYENSARFGKAF